MKITIEIDNKSEMDKLYALFKTFNVSTVKVISPDDVTTPVLRGNKNLNPESLIGIWANKPRSLESIRKDAWQRKQDIA